MSILEKIRAQGFALKPVDSGIYIEPIHELSEEQRDWLIEQKPQIRRELLQERWEWFLSLAAHHGVQPVAIKPEFPTQADRMDVVEPQAHDNEILKACMATLCKDARVIARQCEHKADR